MRKLFWAIAALGIVLQNSPLPALPADHPEPGGGARSPQGEDVAKAYFTDVTLLNQYGEEMRLYSDLIDGKVVVISSFFTSCTGVCPLLNGKLLEISKSQKDRLGHDLILISISVDPETDTVPRLKEYAGRYGDPDGWYFLSGKKENVEAALSKLGLYVDAREAHQNIFLVGNARTGLWKKAFGLAAGEDLVRIVEEVANDG